eukprot:15672-Heterococcus_DN1.PRE.2
MPYTASSSDSRKLLRPFTCSVFCVTAALKPDSSDAPSSGAMPDSHCTLPFAVLSLRELSSSAATSSSISATS